MKQHWGKQARVPRLVGVALAVCCAAPSVYAGPAFVLGELNASSDSADFDVNAARIGAGWYTGEQNFIDRVAYRRGTRKYSGPGFARRASEDTLLGAKMLGSGSDAVKAEAELSRFRLAGGAALTLGAGQLSGQVTSGLNYEARFEKDVVESANGLQHGVTYTAYTAGADYALTPRFILAGLLGRMEFSDDNARSLYKAKAIYVVSEAMGVSVYAKGRRYTNSHPGSVNYFAPAEFNDALAGLQFRRRVAALKGMASAYVEAGRQHSGGISSPAHGWEARLESFPNKPWAYTVGVGQQSSADGAGGPLSAGSGYTYRYARATVLWNF